MVSGMRKVGPVLVVAVALAAVVAGRPAQAWPFCTPGPTLLGEVDQAHMVLFGTTLNANEEKETTDLKVEIVIKDHKDRKDRQQITLKRYIPPTLDGVK